jgi:hypothetical protein
MKWNNGHPPAPGWYPAKPTGAAWANSYRWWDGKRWSWPAFPHETAEQAGKWASKKEQGEILWGTK